MRWLTIVVAVLALALAGAGCGGGDDESSGDSGITVLTDTTSTEETSVDETSTDETETDAAGGFSGDCLELVQASATLGQAFAGAGGDADTDFFDNLAESAPDEIRADFEVLARVYREYVDALADIDLSPGETPSAEQQVQLQQALASIDQTGVTEANERITAWAETNCPGG